ncbi:MAG: hypothetical protein EPO65_11400 [Dehalococcoidia bacterium]|nr:MAG: hypothetical protein EPO65_11400 [Dehalococcoidia bacterium]
MADLLPGFESAAEPRPRNWHNYDDYRLVHERQMDALVQRGVIVAENVEFREQYSSITQELERVRVIGRITLSSGALLDVDKWLGVRDHNGRPEVIADVYAYHAWVVEPDGTELPIFRYDNSDDDDLASLHRHRYYTDGTQRERTEAVPHDRMPYLSEVIEEADRLGYIR